MRLERGAGERRHRGRQVLALLFLAACATAAPGGAQGQPVTRPIEERQAREPELPEAPAAASPVHLPLFPGGEDLVELDPDAFDHRVRVFLDPSSLSQPAPEVVRYTMLLVSAAGKGNLFYESINCENEEWRTLAFGTREGTFELVREPRWRTLDAGASTGYRRVLARSYVCILGRRLPDRAEDLQRRLLTRDATPPGGLGVRWDR